MIMMNNPDNKKEYTIILCVDDTNAHSMWGTFRSIVYGLSGIKDWWYKSIVKEGSPMWKNPDDPSDYVYAGYVYAVETTDDEIYLFMNIQNFTPNSRSEIMNRAKTRDRIYLFSTFLKYLLDCQNEINRTHREG